jgi:spermidine/putrescine transport system permease protein
MTKSKLTFQRSMMLIIMLPMWMNLVILVNSWTTILAENGIINTILGFFGIGPIQLMYNSFGVILGMVYCYIPYMILPIYSILSKLDESLLEASADLGANAFQRFRRVILPLSLPGVISGVTMVFVPSISTFYISQALGGKTKLIGDFIESFFKGTTGTENYNLGAALSLVLMVFIIISLAIMNRFSSDDESGGVII